MLDRWEMVCPLGDGAFGTVYEARHRTIEGRRAAVKILHPQMAAQVDMRRRFLNEASAASRAEHENIVQVFDCGETQDGLCYVVMELLRGSRLFDALSQGAIGPHRTLNIAAQIASALAAAHAAGIVHRDLKPENIFLCPRDHNPEFVKVLDFGIAKLWDAGGHTRTGMWMGTPAYMSPEQWQTLPDIDGRSDIYSLGVILYYCLTGELPFGAESPYQWLQAHLNSPVPDPAREAPADTPPALSALVLRMMAKSRDERPRHMREVLALLQGCMSSAPFMGTPIAAPPPRKIAAPRSSPLSTTRAGSGESRVVSVPFRLAGVGGAALLLGTIGVIGLGLYRRVPAPAAARNDGAVVRSAMRPAVLPPAVEPSRRPPPLPLELVVLGPGSFTASWGKTHPVSVDRFALGKYEVTQKEFRNFMEATGAAGPFPWEGIDDFSAIAGLPVNQVPRAQADAYCRWRYAHLKGRLPTEAEWEYAARQGQARARFPWPGQVLDRARANAGSRPAALMPVQSLPAGATPTGIHHLIGNVAEWTDEGVVRGGGANAPLRGLSATSRAIVAADTRDPFIGFRCAASAP